PNKMATTPRKEPRQESPRSLNDGYQDLLSEDEEVSDDERWPSENSSDGSSDREQENIDTQEGGLNDDDEMEARESASETGESRQEELDDVIEARETPFEEEEIHPRLELHRVFRDQRTWKELVEEARELTTLSVKKPPSEPLMQ